MDDAMERKPTLDYTEMWAGHFGSVQERESGERTLSFCPSLYDVADQVSMSLEVLPLLNAVDGVYRSEAAINGIEVVTMMLCENAQKVMSALQTDLKAARRKSKDDLRKVQSEKEITELKLDGCIGLCRELQAKLDKTNTVDVEESPERTPVNVTG